VFGLELEAQTPLAQPAWMAPPRFIVGGLLRLEIHGEPGRAYTVETSTDLTDWTPFLTRTNQEQTRIVFEVPHSDGARRFFRVVTQP
jgi:hypothetical protein